MPDDRDRVAVRARPGGGPVLRQHWGKLLFLHWRVPAPVLRPLVPPGLELDLFEGHAWVGIVPFTIWGSRPHLAPPLPWVGAFHELNTRTYVYRGHTPGVWFFSLDAGSALAVAGARALYHLPYYRARIRLDQRGDTITYASRRVHAPRPAAFEAEWTLGGALPDASVGTLEFFLMERYCLFAARGTRLWDARVHHAPYPLRSARLASIQSSVLEAAGIPEPVEPPLVHFAEHVAVDIWPPRRIDA